MMTFFIFVSFWWGILFDPVPLAFAFWSLSCPDLSIMYVTSNGVFLSLFLMGVLVRAW